MKIGALTAVCIFGVCGFPMWAASTRDELVSELTIALEARDKAAFKKCWNFEGADLEQRKIYAEVEDQIFSWPTHYVLTQERSDEGKMHATHNGKNYTLNGDWSFFIDIYLSEPPSKGFVLPAGMANGKYLILLRTEEKP
jgi:hypothetical protein